jgi:hypothetical protein
VDRKRIDFEAEGLLEGLDEATRAARRDLLEQLAADGATLDELKRAVAEDRLALLPVERVLAGEGRYRRGRSPSAQGSSRTSRIASGERSGSRSPVPTSACTGTTTWRRPAQ